LIKKFGSGLRSCSLWAAFIGIGIGVAVAIAIGWMGLQKPIATAIATAIPIPTDMVFSSPSDAAKCQPTYELIGLFSLEARSRKQEARIWTC
jgi:hypothetical protein